MELTSVIKGLQLLSMPCKVTVISDSQLIVNTINLWLDRWVSNGWKTYKGASVMNQGSTNHSVPVKTSSYG